MSYKEVGRGHYRVLQKQKNPWPVIIGIVFLIFVILAAANGG